ncbi:hypothetical protein [Dokdonia sp. R78006]|uniref:hypothetical protein n=1 Tax=Dokdonia sp. R78006 TaxID=3093866 RepID=UPI0036D43D36
MRIVIFFLSFIICSCGNAELVTVNRTQVQNEKPTDLERKTIENPEYSKGDVTSLYIQAANFGAKGDAIQLVDFSVKGNELRSNSALFTDADRGKIVSIASAGGGGQHLLSTIYKVINPTTVLLNDRALNNVSNVMGSYGTDNIIPLQDAINASIKGGLDLRVNEGVYLIGDINSKTKQTSLRIEMTQSGQSFKLIGAGKNKTVFRELDGKTQRFGRYTKIFYHYLNNKNNINEIELSDFSIDKNGRSLTKIPSSLYEWEQAHGWSWASSKNAPERIESIKLKNLEIIDKIGAGINFSAASTKVGRVIIENITEKDFNGYNRPNLKYGQRGDLEISCFSDNILMENLDLRYIQVEPVASSVSTRERQRHAIMRNSTISTIEYTEGDYGDPMYSSLKVDNVTSTDFVVRSIRFEAVNSTLTIKRLLNSVDGVFDNCKILLPYDINSNTIKSVNASYLTTLGKIKNKILFNNCSFTIDSNNKNIIPKGFAIYPSSKVMDVTLNSISITNSTFDKRLEGSIYAYGNGEWNLSNNKLAGKKTIITGGSYGVYASALNLSNNTIDELSSGSIYVNNNNQLWTIDFSRENKAVEERLKLKKPGIFEPRQIKK